MGTRRITHQICMMMYGFGDSHEPNPETVRLVESIVLKQLRMIVHEATKYWDGQLLKGEDLVFLLRHNKSKMQRFVRYLKSKDLTKKARSFQQNVIEIDPVESQNKLLDFIEKIDETGEFMDMTEVDEVKMRRMMRADRISQELSEEKYLEFQKARCTSFKSCNANLDNIRQWIDPKDEIKFYQPALEVLSYFAFQTVAEIVDYALLIREDSQTASDLLSHLQGSYYTATMFNAPHGLERRRIDCTRIHTNQSAISVDEVKEVMRRIYNPQAGKLNFGGKVPDSHYILAI